MYYLCQGILLFRNHTEQLQINYTHTLKYDLAIRKIEKKNEIIKLSDTVVVSDPHVFPQCSIRTEDPTDVPLIDIDTADTYILKEEEATNALSSWDMFEDEISNGLALNLKIIPRYNKVDATDKILISTSKCASPKLKLIVLLTAKRRSYHGMSKSYRDRQRTLRVVSIIYAYDNSVTDKLSVPMHTR